MIAPEHRAEFERISCKHRRKQHALLVGKDRMKWLRHRYDSSATAQAAIRREARAFIAPWLEQLRARPCGPIA